MLRDGKRRVCKDCGGLLLHGQPLDKTKVPDYAITFFGQAPGYEYRCEECTARNLEVETLPPGSRLHN